MRAHPQSVRQRHSATNGAERITIRYGVKAFSMTQIWLETPVRLEQLAPKAWEHVAMAFGQRFPGKGPDAVFSALFLVATALNYLPVALGGTVPELVAAGALHLLLAVHIGTARSRASRQRTQDLERFEALKRSN